MKRVIQSFIVCLFSIIVLLGEAKAQQGQVVEITEVDQPADSAPVAMFLFTPMKLDKEKNLDNPWIFTKQGYWIQRKKGKKVEYFAAQGVGKDDKKLQEKDIPVFLQKLVGMIMTMKPKEGFIIDYQPYQIQINATTGLSLTDWEVIKTFLISFYKEQNQLVTIKSGNASIEEAVK